MIVANDDFAGLDPFCEKLSNVFQGCFARERFGEWVHDQVIQPRISEQGLTLINGIEKPQLMLLGMQYCPRMWMESQQDRFTP